MKKELPVENVEICTRLAPHICCVNGPCNGWPKDIVDTCLVCGTEVPPGPDFCSAECEMKAEKAKLPVRDY